MTTIAGSGASGLVNDTGTTAQFNQPAGITTDGAFLYVADQMNHAIRKINITSLEVTTIAGDGTIGTTNGPGSSARFSRPTAITTDGTNLYVADMDNHLIRQIVIATEVVSTLAGGATGGSGCGGNDATCIDATGVAAQFETPHDLTTDGTNVYVADQNNNRIRQIVISTGVVTTLAGTGETLSVDSSDGTGATAKLNEPEGITTDGTYIFFTDWGADTVNPYETVLRRTTISTGDTNTLAGGALGGSGCDGNDTFCQNGTGTAAQFYWAHDLASDGTYLYLADFYNDRIRRVE